jgi:cytochrome P450
MLSYIQPYLTPVYLVPGLIVLYYVGRFISNAALDRKVRRLGARAPMRTSYFPYGLDMIYQVLTYMLRDESLQLWQKMMKEHGKGGWTLEAGSGERVILTAEPENIKAILATQFKQYGKGETFRQEWFPFLGNGIFAVDGDMWHDSRQLIRPQFVKDRISDLVIFEEHVQVLIKKLEEEGQVDMLDMFFRYVPRSCVSGRWLTVH